LGFELRPSSENLKPIKRVSPPDLDIFFLSVWRLLFTILKFSKIY